jgi:hypothetical protein
MKGFVVVFREVFEQEEKLVVGIGRKELGVADDGDDESHTVVRPLRTNTS